MALSQKEVVEGIGKFIPLLGDKRGFHQLNERRVPCDLYNELAEHLVAVKGDHWKKVVG